MRDYFTGACRAVTEVPSKCQGVAIGVGGCRCIEVNGRGAPDPVGRGQGESHGGSIGRSDRYGRCISQHSIADDQRYVVRASGKGMGGRHVRRGGAILEVPRIRQSIPAASLDPDASKDTSSGARPSVTEAKSEATGATFAVMTTAIVSVSVSVPSETVSVTV